MHARQNGAGTVVDPEKWKDCMRRQPDMGTGQVSIVVSLHLCRSVYLTDQLHKSADHPARLQQKVAHRVLPLVYQNYIQLLLPFGHKLHYRFYVVLNCLVT